MAKEEGGGNGSDKTKLNTPLLDELEKGPWPGFVTDLKSWSKQKPKMAQLLNQLEDSHPRWPTQ